MRKRPRACIQSPGTQAHIRAERITTKFRRRNLLKSRRRSSFDNQLKGAVMPHSKVLTRSCWIILLFTGTREIGFSQLCGARLRLPGVGFTVGINPLNPNSVYAERGAGKLYDSYNRGRSWNLLGTPGPSGIRQILVHPNDTLTIFCVGEDTTGLRRSTNNGATWTKVIANYGLDGEALTYDPLHPDTMYAGNFFGGGIFRSLNRGATWTMIGTVGVPICGLTIRPDSLNIMYAGSGTGKISKSTDFGAHWRVVKNASGDEIPRIEINRTNPLVAYASNYGLSNNPAVHFWKTTDGGETWLPTALPSTPTWALSPDLINPDLAYTGVFGPASYSTIVYKTTDGGNSWTSLCPGIPSLDAWSLKVHPMDPSVVWLSG